MPKTNVFWWHLLSATILALSISAPLPQAHAQDTPAASAKTPSIRITFLPPPLEGTFSVGIFDRAGKLVRSLHREAAQSAFTTGLNGLITSWDGKDDHGTALPSGKYRVRGLAVGDLELTGEAFHCNDWVSAEEGPRPVRFTNIGLDGALLVLEGVDVAGQSWKFRHSLADDSIQAEPLSAAAGSAPAQPLPTSCPGRDGSRWIIEKVLGEPIVVQMDAAGEVARRLSIGAGEPAPVGIAASLENDEVFLLEQNGERWRLRGLRRKAPKTETPPGASGGPIWETFLEKNRWPSSLFTEVAGKVGRAKPFVSLAKVTVRSRPNPLFGDASSSVELAVGTDSDGSFLKTVDGLPLRRLTDTARLRWAVLGHDNNQPELVLLQSDGAVVEEYRIRQPNKLMPFDAGEYQWPAK